MPRKKSGAPKQKKPRSPTVATHLPKDPQALYTHCGAVWAAMKSDATHFPSPYPAPTDIEADLTALGDAIHEAEGGDPASQAALLVAAGKVRQTFNLLGKYVQRVVRAGAIADAPAIITSVLMYVSNVGQRKPKPELAATEGPTPGSARAAALAVAGATAYFWELSNDSQTFAVVATTSQAHAAITGLTPGKPYYLRVRALRRDGTMTGYSQVISFMIK